MLIILIPKRKKKEKKGKKNQPSPLFRPRYSQILSQIHGESGLDTVGGVTWPDIDAPVPTNAIVAMAEIIKKNSPVTLVGKILSEWAYET